MVVGRWSFVALLLAAALSGCSSGGWKIGGGQVQQDRSSQFVTSVQLVHRWTQIIYNLQPPAASSCTPSVGAIQVQPDGSRVQQISYAECVQETRTTFRDGHTVIQDQYPDGSSSTTTVSAVQPRGNVFNISVQQTFSNGDSVSYTYSRDTRGTPFNQFDDLETWQGQILFKDHTSGAFAVKQDDAKQMSTLQSALPDGTQFTMTVPLQKSNKGETPVFTSVTSGSYAIGGDHVDFQLAGAGSSSWNEWTLSAPGGVTGRFQINPDFSGSGQFLRNGQIDSSITFDKDGHASVTLVSGEATTAGPTAAVLAFLAHAWRAMFASGAPGPGV